MKVIEKTGDLAVSVCTTCQCLWLQGDEAVVRLTKELTLKGRDSIPPEILEHQVRFMEQDQQERRELEVGEMDPPDSAWKVALSVTGVPVFDRDDSIPKSFPGLTVSIALALVLVASVTMPNSLQAAIDFGLVPSDPWRYGGLTFLTSFFLHADLAHLLFNIAFLLLFGSQMERILGRARFVTVLGLALVAGGVLHVAFNTSSTLPVVGASGAVSGLILAFVVVRPTARIVLFLWRPFLLVMGWFRVPAALFAVLWAFFQIPAIAPGSPVAGMAHVGGALAGIVLGLRARSFLRLRQETAQSIC